MIDFSTLKRLTIPEGKVKQITDVDGNVLWSALSQITFSGLPLMPNFSAAYISIPNGEVELPSTLLGDVTVGIPEGTIIRCFVGADTGYEGVIILNGEVVYTKTGQSSFITPITGTYDYIVTRDARIKVSNTGTSNNRDQVGTITITET